MIEEEWLTARDRALLYVRVLSLPALEGLEYALEALRRAQADLNRNPHLSPTAQTIRRLRERLSERLSGAEENPGSPPLLNRGSMVPEGMNRQQWRRTLPERPSRQPGERASSAEEKNDA